CDLDHEPEPRRRSTLPRTFLSFLVNEPSVPILAAAPPPTWGLWMAVPVVASRPNPTQPWRRENRRSSHIPPRQRNAPCCSGGDLSTLARPCAALDPTAPDAPPHRRRLPCTRISYLHCHRL